MFKEESIRLEKFMNPLPKCSKTKYALWDIQDLLDFEDPELPQSQKMDIEFSYDNSTKPDAADQSDPKDMDLDRTDADLFQPAPTHWKQIMTLPLHLRKHWDKSFKSELNTLLKMRTFAIEEKPKD